MKIAIPPALPTASDTKNSESNAPDTLAANDPQSSFVQALKRARANAPRKPAKDEAQAAKSATGAAPGSATAEPGAAGTEQANERNDPSRRMPVPEGSQPVSYPGLPGQPVTWPGTPSAQAWLAAGQAGTGKGVATTDAPVMALPATDATGAAAASGSSSNAAARRGGGHAAALQEADSQLSATAELAAQTEAANSRETSHDAGSFADALRAAQPAGGAPGAAAPATAANDTTAAAQQAAQQAAQAMGLSPADAGGLVATATLAVPVNEAGFAPALASQLTSFLRDGVQQAELNLNPAELGPVRVSIAVEGTQAQVEFSASQALTRVALEQSLPALASALHQAGFTLTGGGVSDQGPRDQAHRGEGAPGQASAENADLGGTGARTGASARRSQHLLDLFA